MHANECSERVPDSRLFAFIGGSAGQSGDTRQSGDTILISLTAEQMGSSVGFMARMGRTGPTDHCHKEAQESTKRFRVLSCFLWPSRPRPVVVRGEQGGRGSAWGRSFISH